MTPEYTEIAATRCGSREQNRQTSSRAAMTSANGAQHEQGADGRVIALHETNQARSANHIRRRPRRHRSGPEGYLSAAQLAQRADAALSSVYHWINTGKLGKPHRWRNLLVVSEKTADEFLVSVKPVQGAAGEGARDD